MTEAHSSPAFDVKSDSGEPEGCALRGHAAVNTEHANRKHAAHIVLPLIPVPLP